jgi:ADP-ribose pyrophosphatase YjhB (NUDIX family)
MYPTKRQTSLHIGSFDKKSHHHKYYDVCNNCGKQGHTFKQCKNPITSYGVIVFRMSPMSQERQYLMIRRKDTLGYIDFMRGKYSVSNQTYILNMIHQMTVQEKNKLKCFTFDELWRDLWKDESHGHLPNRLMMTTSTTSTCEDNSDSQLKRSESQRPVTEEHHHEEDGVYQTYKQEELNSREKFHYLISKTMQDIVHQSNVSLHPDVPMVQSILHYLIQCSDVSPSPHTKECSHQEIWTEPEWGFPKGRRNYQEKDYDCALREMTEETGYPLHLVKNIKNILPFDEIFLGSNYKSYKHKYYLMYMNYDDSLSMDHYDKSEVSLMQWKSYNECMKCIRPYNLEKKRLITSIEHTLVKYRLKGNLI